MITQSPLFEPSIIQTLLWILKSQKTIQFSTKSNNKCDWACKNRAYLHKLHMFRKWYFSWSVLMIFMFCKFSLLSYCFVNKAERFYCHCLCASKDIVSWNSKIRPNLCVDMPYFCRLGHKWNACMIFRLVRLIISQYSR